MATTNSLLRDAEYVIYRAFRLLRKISSGDTLEDDELADALTTLQDMMRGWENGDDPTHKKITLDVTLTGSKGMYELGALARVRDVHHVQFLYGTNGGESQLMHMDGETYMSFPVKDSVGAPAQYHFDRSPSSMLPSEAATDASPDASKLYLWPKPSAALVASGAKLYAHVSVPYAVPQALDDELDVPQEWFDAVAYCLAAELYDEYGGNAGVIPKAAAKWENVKEADRPSYIDIVAGAA